MLENQKADVEFLNDLLRDLQKFYSGLVELSPHEVFVSPPSTSDAEERCARIADHYGFDGHIFRNLIPPLVGEGPDLSRATNDILKRIRMIPRIIAAIEQQELADYSPAKSPSEWAADYHCHWDTLNKRFKDGTIRFIKLTTKSYRIHKDDLP